MNVENEKPREGATHRRIFVKQTIAAALTGIAGISLISGAKAKAQKGKKFRHLKI